MKNNFKVIGYRHLLVLFLSLFVAQSCYEDLSKTPTMDIEEIVRVLEDDEVEELIVYYGSKFSYSPTLGVIVGVDTIMIDETNADNYSFNWAMSVGTDRYWGTTDTVGISTDMNLEMNVESLPNTSNYMLILTVEDIAKGFKSIISYKTYVRSNFGPGLLIAQEIAPGNNDISLLSSREFDSSFDDSSSPYIVHHDLYSKYNGAPYMHRIDDMHFYNSSSNTESSGIRLMSKDYGFTMINVNTFKTIVSGDDMFYFTPPARNFMCMASQEINNTYMYVINDGYYMQHDHRDGIRLSHIEESVREMYNFSPITAGPTYRMFDLKSNAFFGDSWGEPSPIAEDKSDDAAFNPAAIDPTHKPIFAQGNKKYESRWIFESEAGEYFLYVLATSSSRTNMKQNISQAVDFDKAEVVYFSRTNNEIYYGVENKLWVMIADGGTFVPANNKVVLELPAGETITHLYDITDYYSKGETTFSEDANGEPIYIDSDSRVIVMASYNDTTGEGTIRTLPIEYVGAGDLAAEKYFKVVGGFGRITAIANRY